MGSSEGADERQLAFTWRSKPGSCAIAFSFRLALRLVNDQPCQFTRWLYTRAQERERGCAASAAQTAWCSKCRDALAALTVEIVSVVIATQLAMRLLSSFQAWTYTAAGQLAFWGCTGTLTQPLSMAQLAALMTKVAPFTSVMFFACVSCLV